MLELVSVGRDVTCDIKVDCRAQGGCYLCELFDFRLRNNRHILVRTKTHIMGPKFKLRYRKIRFYKMVLEICEIDENETKDDPTHWIARSTSVTAVHYNGKKPRHFQYQT